MKLHLRLALPLFAVAAAVTLAGMLGAMALITRTASVGLRMQEKQVARVVESVLAEKTAEADKITTVLGILDGNAQARLTSWEHAPVDFTAILDKKTGRVISSSGSPADKSDLEGIPSALDRSPLLLRSAKGLLIASVMPDKNNSSHLVLAAYLIKQDTGLKLRNLLQGGISVSMDGQETRCTAGNTKGSALDASYQTPGGGRADFRLYIPLEELLHERRDALVMAVAGGLVLLAVALLFYNWSLARVTRPIREMALATHQVASGEQAVRLPAGAPGELGELVKRFNEMAGKLREAQERLVHSAKLSTVGQMTAGISHELNNPLTGLIMHAEAQVAKLPKGKPGRAEAEVILNEAQRMKRILGDLRDMAKPGTGKTTRLDLNSLVRDAISFIGHQAKKANVQVKVDLTSAKLVVDAVPDQIRQILLNLALNSIEAMPNGGKLAISTRAEKGKAQVSVRDSGKGISHENRKKALEPFFTTKPGRIGLGLAISSEAAKRHGGSLSLDGAPGHGTLAILELPLTGTKS